MTTVTAVAAAAIPKNLINAERVTQIYGDEPTLREVSLGINAGDRIGVVGRNGAGKSTLLGLLTETESPVSGRVSISRGTRIGYLKQRDPFQAGQTIRDAILSTTTMHDIVTDAGAREVLDALIGGHDDTILDRSIDNLSGGERRRVDLARLLVSDTDVLVLDEPTNHLDIEVVEWLADHIKRQTGLALLVVTHDRWFLDDVCERMWEVIGGGVEQYEGGYSAFVLAKAERSRQLTIEQHKRNNLIRKELAWLRRGPPARTSKPKFRIDAANELIATEPPARNSAELLNFANARLGKTVFETKDVQIRAGGSLEGEILVDHLTWDVGPGQRLGVLGANGSGKTTLINALLGLVPVSEGTITTGVTVKPAYLSQHLEELDPSWRVLEAVERVAKHVTLGTGKDLSASQLCERIGFGADGQWTPVADLSGGERRRLQLVRLLMGEPNVLVLDEPTNDFDTETLTALEDLLDGFAGTLIVISHDRYFLERVCDNFRALLGDGILRDLPGGVEQYLTLRREQPALIQVDASPTLPSDAADERRRRKDLARIERQLDKANAKRAGLLERMAEHAADHTKILALSEDLRLEEARIADLEEEWFAASD
jgi:ATP-binding cassette subfamily F protein uup